MSDGYIDSASVNEILSFYRYDQPKGWPDWTWRSALETTCAVINVQNLKMAPAPSLNKGPATGAYEHLTGLLRDTIHHIKFNSKINDEALVATRKWATKNTKKIIDVNGKFESDRKNFLKWMNNAVRNTWIEHSQRLNGLFNIEFIPQLSLILNINEPELKIIHKQSCDLRILRRYSNGRRSDPEFKIMKDAYITSALIRGVYHDYVARKSEYQIIHHPFRAPVLDKLDRTQSSEYPVSNTLDYLASIILVSSFAEKKLENRISCWVENVRKAREAILSERLDLRHKSYEDIALESAVEAAKKIKVRNYTRMTERVLNIIGELCYGQLKRLILSPWLAIPAEVASNEVKGEKRLGTRIADTIFVTSGRLEKLANSVPGRIETEWEE